jgi:hypothetical protein
MESGGAPWSRMVESDFIAARIYLRKARLCLQGGDKVSEEATEALDLLIVAVNTAELTRFQREVIPFRPATDRSPRLV